MKIDDSSAEQKLLVLLDFSKGSINALRYAISLAKIIETKLVLLYIAKPLDVVDSDNRSIVLKALDSATKKKEIQFKSIMEMIEAEGVSAEYINTMGDVPTQIRLYSEKHNPSLIVIGKSGNSENSLGKTANYLVNEDTRNVLIIGGSQEFNDELNILVECNAEAINKQSINILFKLNKKTKSSFSVFINRGMWPTEEFKFPKEWLEIASSPHKIYKKSNQLFSTTKSMMNHIAKEKVDMVCIDRSRKGVNNSFFTKLLSRSSRTNEVINNARIPTLIMGEYSKFEL